MTSQQKASVKKKPSATTTLTFSPLTKETWKDFEHLFGERGACGGCWCMSWRLQRSEFEKNKGDGNKKEMKKLANSSEQIGIIAYLNNQPFGWCAVAPREQYVKLETARVLKRIDNKPVWSIVCFFLAKEYRRCGFSVELLKGVINYCKKKRVKIIEAYPIIPYSSNMPAAFAWTGFLSSFKKAGFTEEKRWSKARPIVRCYL
jgi:GNAT superfamily N-acetyltransferase